MQVHGINNNYNNTNFGHSFRVSICLKNENGCGDYFVSPSSNKKLYKQLNSNLVSWFNENYYSYLRRILGAERKTGTPQKQTHLQKQLVQELKKIDTDYSQFQYVRSVYNGGRLAYIATGIDVPIIENLKGAKNIGTAKSDSALYNGFTNSEYVKNLSKLISTNILDYVKDNNVLLRSKDNKEIMLRAVFKEIKDKKGKTSNYELDRFEFHENKTNPTLHNVNNEFLAYKYAPSKQEEIRKTIKRHAEKILGRKINLIELNKIMNHEPIN